MRKAHHFLRFALLAVLSLSALAPLPRAAVQEATPSAGSEQTPIDIRDEDLTFVEDLPALGFSYGTKVTLNVVNTGSPGEFDTVRAELQNGNNTLTIGNITYELKQFHFHTPSEHELNGEKFPAEMHLVHQATDGSGKLLVVGAFIKSGRQHAELSKFFSHLPDAAGEQFAVARFNLTRLLPESLESFRYDGSLTTPDPSGVFKEGVGWVVLAEPVEMSPEQIEAFTQLFPHGNSREVQPLNGRTIRTDVEPSGE